jgi:hypothetical protein
MRSDQAERANRSPLLHHHFAREEAFLMAGLPAPTGGYPA